jgi:hypothetical protein
MHISKQTYRKMLLCYKLDILMLILVCNRDVPVYKNKKSITNTVMRIDISPNIDLNTKS